MKTFILSFICLVLSVTTSIASTLDLITFSTMGDASIAADGTISFTENVDDAAIYAYDDFFAVPGDAASLTFSYELAYGAGDYDDYLTFEVDFVPILEVFSPETGSYTFDLSGYAGTSISLAWGLIWGGDWDATTTASVFDIQLETVSLGDPVATPEPSTYLLLATGLAGLAVYRRKSKS